MKPELAKALPVEYNVPLKAHHTFGIDVQARKLIRIWDESVLQLLLEANASWQSALFVLAGGSNILFTQDVEALVIKNEILGKEVLESGSGKVRLRIGAGENWHQLVLYCIEQGWGGLENLSLIPGCVGAAPIQNIGAYGVELQDVFDSLEAVHIETGRVETFDKEACQFGYRDSVFKGEKKGKYIITRVILRLTEGNHHLNTTYGSIQQDLEAKGILSPNIRDISEVVCDIRQRKLPDPNEIGNAGSFFKNPIIPEAQFTSLQQQYPDIPFYPDQPGMIKVPAAWLIQTAGWKGHRRGRLGVHDRQALVLVNHGGARGRDIYQLSEEIRVSVRDRFKIDLHREVKVY